MQTISKIVNGEILPIPKEEIEELCNREENSEIDALGKDLENVPAIE